MVDWVSVGDECILAGKCFHLFSLTLTRTNVIILRKLALCVIVHPLETLPRHFPPAVALSSIASISSLAMLVYGASAFLAVSLKQKHVLDGILPRHMLCLPS